MSTPCTTNADCLSLLYPQGNITAPRDWCVTSVNCDAHYGSCVVWPRCTSYPYWGCLAAQQLCVSAWRELGDATDGSTTATIFTWATLNTPQVLVPIILFSILYVILVILGIMATWRYCCETPGKHNPVRDDILIPMVSLDGALPQPDQTRVMAGARAMQRFQHFYEKLTAVF